MPTPQKKYYTYADYATWTDDARYELIEGVPYLMSPAPTIRHQKISGELFGQLHSFLKGKPCEVYHAPVEVRLNAESRDDIVLQPDLIVVCDKTKLQEKNCVGAPDMVIEILSPSTTKHDKLRKFNLYLRYGVKEYWIVDPDARYVEVFLLDNGAYKRYGYDETESVSVTILPGLAIDLAEVFA